MSLKTYDRKGQVWLMTHPSYLIACDPAGLTTLFILKTQGRVKKKKLIVYEVLVSSAGRVWTATLSDNLKSRWETDPRMRRLV